MTDEPKPRPPVEDQEQHVDRSVLIGLGGRWVTDWALRLAILLVAGWLVSRIGGALWVGILPILLALIVSTVLWPPTGWMVRHRVPTTLAALLSIIASLGLVSGVIALIAPSIVEQSVQLADQTSEAITQVQDWLRGPPLNIRDEQLDGVLEQLSSTLQDRGDQIASGVFTGVSAVGSFVITLVLVLVLTFFFIKDGPRFLPFVRRISGRTAGRHLTEVLTRAWNTLGGYIRAQAIVSFVDAVLIGLALVILGVPLAWALAVITFIAGFIPIVGAFTAGALAVLIALVANGFTTAIIVLVVIILVQQLEGNVLQPIVQSRAMNLHPGVILLGVAAGSTLFGIIGAFLAVPLLAVLAVALRYINEQIDLRTGDVTASDLASATDEGRLTAWLAELSSSRFAPLRKSSTAIMAGMIDERPDIAGPRRPVTTRAGAGVTVEADDDEVGGGSTTAAPGLSDEPPPAAGPVDPKAVDGYRPSPQEQEAEKPNPLRRFGRFLARRLGG
ncbi:Predicted PurR-regulated permease PerM [Dietzia kunjamensis subsp. schimae]|uniref:Predicted PurR-regulated permease PerM n=1 Tax=Dietzia kunjamensis subsp. schimae TaxID=498198 RepID=A0ABY1MWU2_9ACTN|nr:AI-2E family transporter [Dietzia kunjamensis]MBB1013924.1 AI-2E family transporter [Dietzia kunjamensis subsp. schimae]SMO40679.1 Predicted PurR-regulated permease PerM [Dietzia kunjamensis subsp. schimae]